jgi:hypothetical protein
VKRLLAACFFCLITSGVAFAHGEHGNAAAPTGTSPVTVDGYQIEVLTFPAPLVAGKPGQVVVKVLRGATMEPVSGGNVAVGFGPMEAAGAAEAHSTHSAHAAMGGNAASLTQVSEVTYAGSYTLDTKPEKSGPHMARVALAALDGKTFSSPIVVDFHFDVATGRNFSPALIAAALAAVSVVFIGVGRTAARARGPREEGAPLDLLRLKWLDRFVRWRGFQPVFQIPVLVLTLLLAYLGFADVQDGAQNLATRLTWIIWWPGIIFTFVLVGRFWCVMCPFGALNEWTSKWAAPKRMFPKALRNLWLATFLFVLLTWFDEQLGIIRSPFMTASVIVLLATLAIVTGLFYQRRTFCRYLCPITGLQGLYSMISPIELRARDRSRCQTECHQECYRGGVHGDGCPMLEFPMQMERNTFCNFCFECVKSCPPGNLALKTRSFGRELWGGLRKLDEAYLAAALVGITSIVSAQMLAPWGEWVSTTARYLPLELRVMMRPVTYLAVTESALFFLLSLAVAPGLVWIAAWSAVRLSGEPRHGVKQTFITFAGMFIPIGLAMHLAHNASHLLAEAAGVFPALQRTLNRYTLFDFGAPNWQVAGASSEAIQWLQMALIITGLCVSLAAYERLSASWQRESGEGSRALIPFIAAAVFFTVINLVLLNQPMAMRHGM